MRLPRIQGEIERRLLVNYRVDPDVIAPLLPTPFRPQLVNDHAGAGICLIRLGSQRPMGTPSWAGLRSENAAHRIAVEWDGADGVRTGVYIPRRDTVSVANALRGAASIPVKSTAPGVSVLELQNDLSFRQGAPGFSATRDGCRLNERELKTAAWSIEAGVVRLAESSFFDDPAVFPPGSAQLDCALAMRGVPVIWKALPSLRSGTAA